MDEKVVLVTGIGGNVGQGIVRNIKHFNYSIRVVGCDIASFSPGNHLCDKTYQVPYSYEKDYIQTIASIVKKEKIDLIIPSTDYEVYYLALNKQKTGTLVLASDAEIAKSFLDKYLTYQLFSKNRIPFAKSWLPNEYDGSCENIIAKPREGRGSRGILVNPENPESLDKDYMIQALHSGVEITTAVYVSKKAKVHGVFSLQRKLENGASVQTKVNNNFDDQFLEMAKQIVALGGVRGSFNIQSIVDKDGEIHPFEINGRISGTNSIRHNFGFQDVVYALEEYLYGQEPTKPNPRNGIATRILLDVIYTHETDPDKLNNQTSAHFIY